MLQQQHNFMRQDLLCQVVPPAIYQQDNYSQAFNTAHHQLINLISNDPELMHYLIKKANLEGKNN